MKKKSVQISQCNSLFFNFFHLQHYLLNTYTIYKTYKTTDAIHLGSLFYDCYCFLSFIHSLHFISFLCIVFFLHPFFEFLSLLSSHSLVLFLYFAILNRNFLFHKTHKKLLVFALQIMRMKNEIANVKSGKKLNEST